jgi:DnaJ-class molecular chaperone
VINTSDDNKKMCINCAGTGKVVGGGMLTQDCETCDGEGKIDIHNEIKEIEVSKTISEKSHHDEIKIDKRSKDYRDSIKRLQKVSNLTREEAEKMLDKELGN